MDKYNKIFTWGMIALIAISVGILIWGFSAGWETNGGVASDVLLDWAYIMVALGIAAIVVVGLVIGIKNDPKSLVKLGIGIGAVAVLCIIAYLFASGKPAIGLTTLEPTAAELKLTDTILNLAYITGAGAILAIIAGEIRIAVTDKK